MDKTFSDKKGYVITENIAYQDNQAIFSLGKRRRHFDQKIMNDLILFKEVKVKYFPIERMIRDYMTKPLTRTKFNAFQNKIMSY
jgi:hypothetical protein